jgi:beta-phosphoglucomutase-like phosphatase (HAD superfamily)
MGKDVATIKAVIFDLDGTLLDTESLSCRAVIESFDLIGLTIPSEIYASLNDGGLLLPWELKRQMLGLRGSG